MMTMARYIDEINEFVVHTTTLHRACYTRCKFPMHSNTTNFSRATVCPDGVQPLQF